MEKAKKLFGQWGMPWRRVLLMAVVTAVYTALVCIIPPIRDTSLHDIAVYPEWWILFAVLIVVNCKKWWEAALKCFVFFLVSQPLIYLIQVPFVSEHWGIFQYYRYWFVITLLTLPGAAIAYLLKKKNWLSAAVLIVAAVLPATAAVRYARSVIMNFPYHLLSSLCCVVLIVFFAFVLLDQKKHRIAVLAAAAVILLVYAALTMPEYTKEISLGEGNWTCTVENDAIVSAEITENNTAVIRCRHSGSTFITLIGDSGEERQYYATVTSGGIWLEALEE